MKSFSQWTIEEVEDEFELTRQLNSAKLQIWLGGAEPIPDDHQKKLEALRERCDREGYSWNELELIIYFISPLLDLINFHSTTYKTFFTRTISAPYGKETLSGIVDCVVAGGTHSPRQPFFFLQEYKKEHDSPSDPLAQILVAMIAAQILNQNEQPLYGAYIIGRYWHFVLLDGKEYAVHAGMNAVTEECFDIYQALRNTKRIIEEELL